MKREKRHGIERELSIKRICSQKKYSILIVSVLLLTCTLIQIGFQMSEGLKAAYIENRKAVYGEWEQVFVDMDESSVKVAEENPFLAQTGKISIYGAIAGDYLENRQMNIGTMDETAWNLGRLEMKEGRLPENEHEIVMEYSTLRSLGYEEMLGKEITLDITPALSILEQGESKSYSYTLCGILKDYQINWEICNRHRFPTGIVTQEGGNRIGSVQDMHMLVKAKEGSESVYKDLKDSEEFTCGMDDNVEQDKLSDINLPYMDFLENIRLLIGGASICILFLTVSRSIISREQFWRFLDALGMRRGQMYQIIFWEAVLFGAGAVIVGNLAGIGIYQLVIPAFEKITEQTLPQAIAWEGVLFGTGFSILCIAASYGLSAVQLRILLKEKKKKVQKRRGKYRKIVRFTPGRVLLHKWQMYRVRKSVEIVLLASALLTVGFGKMEISTRQEELKVYQRLTGNGYYLSTMEITNSPGISRQTVDKLEQVAGVTSVEQYHNNEKEEFWIDLSEYAKSEYFQKVVETLVAYLNETSIKEKISIEKVRLSLLTIDRWQDIQCFLRNLDEGSLTKEEFEQGDFCILDLTELQEYNGKYLSAFSPDGQGISEDTVQVGDELPVYTLNENGSRNENPIPVTAILRGMKEEDVRNPQIGGSGISMIVGKNFWKKFGKSRIMEYDQIVKILVSDDADAYDTEGYILSILKQGTAVNVQNNHEEYKKIRQELYSFIGMYSIFAVFYMILISIVLYQMFLAEKQEEKREWEILQSLGMEEKFQKKMHRIEVLWMMGCAGVIGVFTLWGAYRLI